MQSSVAAIEKKVNTRRAGGVIDADRHSVGNGFVLPLTSMSCPECMPTGDKDCNDNNDDDRILTSETNSIITTFAHNNRGDLASKTIPGTGTTEYTFNAAGELRRITYPDGSRSIYDYDPFSIRKRRTEKDSSGDITADTRYFYSDLNGLPRIISEEKLFGSDPRFTHYVYAQELLLRDIDGKITYFIVGDNMNVIALVNENGVVTDRYEYSSYGNLQSHTGTDPNRILFSSEPNDEESGLIYLRKRYQNPTSGRFVSKDARKKLGRNCYVYCKNNPIDNVDPLGFQTIYIGIYDTSILNMLDQLEIDLEKTKNYNVIIGKNPSDSDAAQGYMLSNAFILIGHHSSTSAEIGNKPSQGKNTLTASELSKEIKRLKTLGFGQSTTKESFGFGYGGDECTNPKVVMIIGCYSYSSRGEWMKAINFNWQEQAFISSAGEYWLGFSKPFLEKFLRLYWIGRPKRAFRLSAPAPKTKNILHYEGVTP